jgi:hypothetical protein
MHSLLMGAQMPLLGKHESGCAAFPARAATSMWAEHPLAPGLAGPGRHSGSVGTQQDSAAVLLHDKESHGTAQPALVINYSRPNSNQAVGLRRSWIWTSLLISLFFLANLMVLEQWRFLLCSSRPSLRVYLTDYRASNRFLHGGFDGGEKGESAKSKEVRQCLSGPTTRA